jgi:hypothetical protein
LVAASRRLFSMRCAPLICVSRLRLVLAVLNSSQGPEPRHEQEEEDGNCIDAVKAEVVRQLFAWYTDPETPATLYWMAKTLSERQIPTPSCTDSRVVRSAIWLAPDAWLILAIPIISVAVAPMHDGSQSSNAARHATPRLTNWPIGFGKIFACC